MAEENTFMADAIETTASNGDCDAACKKVLAIREIMAWILKEVVAEYKSCSISEIMNCWGDIAISEEPVLPDTVPPTIPLASGEDTTIHEGTVLYDLLFTTKLPNSDNDELALIINVEAQKDFHPDYPLLKRGVYYCARLLSAQNKTLPAKNKYKNLKKVYSIWICTNPDPEYRDEILEYSMSAKSLCNKVDPNKDKSFDLLTLVLVCLDDENFGKESGNNIIKLLSVLLTTSLGAGQKKNILENEFAIKMTKESEEEVLNMLSSVPKCIAR